MCRYLAARELWDSLLTSDKNESTSHIQNVHRDLIELMITRSDELRIALAVSDIDSSWTHGITYFGITTHYKLAADGTIQFRLEGILEDMPIFEQCAVIHEIGWPQ